MVVDEQGFWAVIDATAAESDGDIEAQSDSLREQLSDLSTKDLFAFDEHLTRANHALYSWDLWGAAYLLLGGCSDDSFTDFRTWVVSRGKAAYDRVLADPDALADIPLEDEEEIGLAEEFGYVVGEVYEERTGRRLYETAPNRAVLELPSEEPHGTPFEEDLGALARRYPRLTAVYGTHDGEQRQAGHQVPLSPRRWWQRLGHRRDT